MLTFFKNHKFLIYISLLVLIGGVLRFYNLNWGSPFYFHPDERNIASSVANMNFPNQMNPNFFAYGSFPIYLIYFTGLILNSFLKSQDLFIQSILISRFYSAILSLLIIPSIYFVGKKLINKEVGLLAAAFCTFNTGFIQFSHFGTFEMWLTFLGLLFFYFSLDLINKTKLKTIFICGLIYGFLMATKVSSLPLLVIPFFSILFSFLTKYEKISLRYIGIFAIILCVASIVFFAASPFVLLDFPSFVSSIKYESSVALGTLPVFYTGEFANSIPVIFQFTKIYPFLLNPLMTVIFLLALIYLTFAAFKKNNFPYYLLLTIYYLLFLPQALLFAKWTRYIVLTLPFMLIIISIFLDNLLRKSVSRIKYLVLCVLIAFSVIFSVSYFITAFLKQDTRIKASLWAKENILVESNVLSEIYDMGIVPFNLNFTNISLFNFYDLDQTPNKSSELKSVLSENEYIILPSQRLLKTRFINKDKFPIGNEFYKNLFNGTLGFEKVYETPCDIFCKITYLGDPVFTFEQTAIVFDRPTVYIFQKLNIK